MCDIYAYNIISLSEENKKILSDMLKNNLITDDDVVFIVKRHKKAVLFTKEMIELYDKVLYEDKKFDVLNWPKNSSAKESFIRIFDDNIEILNGIIKNGGVISINDLAEIGNIFNYCEGFEKEAADIAELTTPNGNTASGKFEILLKLLLKEGYTGKSGDVSIKGSPKGMEVKCTSYSAKGNTSGGRPTGQGENYTKPWRIYQWLNLYLLDLGDDTDVANSCQYFQTITGAKDFLNKCNGCNLTTDEILDAIVDSICYQYEFLSIKTKNIKDDKFNTDKHDAIRKAAGDFIGKGQLTTDNIFSLVGCCQLCCYSIVEGFDYLMIPYIDLKNDASSNSGKYLLIKDCQSADSKLYDFDYLTKYIKFLAVGKSTDNRKTAGEMHLIVKNIN